MSVDHNRSRRRFVGDAGKLASLALITPAAMGALHAPSPVPDYVMPTLQDFVDGGAFCLVCDLALGHLARRLATKRGTDQASVHLALREGMLPHSYAVPSGNGQHASLYQLPYSVCMRPLWRGGAEHPRLRTV